ncbi:MAG: signal peptidase II [Acidimicrobiales bacterium]
MQERGPVPALSAPALRRPSRPLAWGGAAAAVVVAVDQATKSWALAALADGPVDVVWTLRLNLSFNTGAAFGIGRGVAPLLVAAGVVVLVVLIAAGRSSATTPTAAVALGLVVGGAAGNLADRLLRDHGGAVVDFIDLQWWPVFNVADAAITCGAALLVVAGARGERPPPGAPPPEDR